MKYLRDYQDNLVWRARRTSNSHLFNWVNNFPIFHHQVFRFAVPKVVRIKEKLT
jgi:hypothetical protein